jgi:hypothetical protein
MATILQGVAAAATITKLEFEAWCVADGDETDAEDEDGETVWKHAPVAACATLAQLTGLSDLCITEYSILPPGDALALTALTNLTRLVVNGSGAGVGSAAAAALMQNLTQLRYLDLRKFALKQAERVIHRKQLTQLQLQLLL